MCGSSLWQPYSSETLKTFPLYGIAFHHMGLSWWVTKRSRRNCRDAFSASLLSKISDGRRVRKTAKFLIFCCCTMPWLSPHTWIIMGKHILSLHVVLALLSCYLQISAFNLDIAKPIVYSGPPDSYFGFSVDFFRPDNQYVISDTSEFEAYRAFLIAGFFFTHTASHAFMALGP